MHPTTRCYWSHNQSESKWALCLSECSKQKNTHARARKQRPQAASRSHIKDGPSLFDVWRSSADECGDSRVRLLQMTSRIKCVYPDMKKKQTFLQCSPRVTLGGFSSSLSLLLGQFVDHCCSLSIVSAATWHRTATPPPPHHNKSFIAFSSLHVLLLFGSGIIYFLLTTASLCCILTPCCWMRHKFFHT